MRNSKQRSFTHRQLQEIHRAANPAKLEHDKHELLEAIAAEDDSDA